MMKNLEVLEEIKKQGKNLIGTKRDEFVKQNLLSDEFIEMMQKNKKTVRSSDVVLSVRHYGNRDKVPGAESGILAFL